MRLPRLVIILSFVSLLNDAASEMITPLLPLFLTGVLGAGAVVVGLVEGAAEAAASLLKYQSGRLADRGWSSRWLVVGGYGLSSAARPAIGLCVAWPAVLALRFLDRAGKGIRTSPRDALIAASVPEAGRGQAFGFHRGMDHAGSIIGPLLATPLLAAGVSLPHVFLLSLAPGVLVIVLLALGLPRSAATSAPASAAARPEARPQAKATSSGIRAFISLDARLRALVLAAGALALALTPEAFLVLWATQNGLGTALVPLLWAAASVVKSLAAYGGGWWSDRAGRLALMLGGWAARVGVLVALALVSNPGATGTWLLFLAYAAALAASEGPERALIGDAAPAEQRATAFGLYHLVYGVLALPGALIFGALWQAAGSAAAFLVAALLATIGITVMAVMSRPAPGADAVT